MLAASFLPSTSSLPPGIYRTAEKFALQNLDLDYLPGWLQQLGYTTHFSGKFLNQFKPIGPRNKKTGQLR